MLGTRAHACFSVTYVRACKCLHVYELQIITTNIWRLHTPIIPLSREQCRAFVRTYFPPFCLSISHARALSLTHTHIYARTQAHHHHRHTFVCLLTLTHAQKRSVVGNGVTSAPNFRLHPDDCSHTCATSSLPQTQRHSTNTHTHTHACRRTHANTQIHTVQHLG